MRTSWTVNFLVVLLTAALSLAGCTGSDQPIEDAVATAEQHAGQARERAEEAAENVGERAQEMGEQVGERTEQLLETAEDRLDEAGERVQELADSAGERLDEAGENLQAMSDSAKESLVGMFEETPDTLAVNADSVQEHLDRGIVHLEGEIENLKDKVDPPEHEELSERLDDLRTEVAELADKSEDELKSAMQAVQEKGRELAEKVQDAKSES